MIIGRWTIEPSREGIPLVFGDGKYPHDPPRVASELEVALLSLLETRIAELERQVAAWDEILRKRR